MLIGRANIGGANIRDANIGYANIGYANIEVRLLALIPAYTFTQSGVLPRARLLFPGAYIFHQISEMTGQAYQPFVPPPLPPGSLKE